MVLLKFNKKFKDRTTKKVIPAGTPVEMTLKRADEGVERIRKNHKGYEDFGYTRVEDDKE